MRRPNLAPMLLVAALLAAALVYLAPRAVEAGTQLAIADDPSAIAGRALDETFNAARAREEIEQALAHEDIGLAKSFVDLAAARDVALDPALRQKVDAAAEESATARHAAESFARGFVTGEPKDTAGLAGTALGDLFVFGDIRDAVREGGRLAMGEPADELLLGLACVGLAITAGTYATMGVGAPARVGLTMAKVARKSGRLGADLAAAVGRSLREAVDWSRLKQAAAGSSPVKPVLAVRAAREAIKVERAGGFMHFVRDVGRVESKAGPQAALDGLKVAQSPADMTRVAKLAEKEGGRTRAVLKLLGRGAIMLTAATFDLGLWIFGALFAAITFVASLKSAVERATLRFLHGRKERRWRKQQRALAAAHA